MNDNLEISDKDREDCLIIFFFGRLINEGKYLEAAINRAYRDFCRILKGISKHKHITETAKETLFNVFEDIMGHNIDSQQKFDDWHKELTSKLINQYKDYPIFSCGHAQKWINMTFKYILLLGNERLPGYECFFTFCHIPIDDVMVKKLKTEGIPWRFNVPWSKLNDHNQYLEYQHEIRNKIKHPLFFEFFEYIGLAR